MAVSVAGLAVSDAADRRGQAAKEEAWDVALLRAMSELLLVTGCDPEMLVSLQLDDVDTTTRSVRLSEGVDPAGRQIHLDEPAWEALRAYMQMRSRGSWAGTHALFCGMDGGPLTGERVYAVLQLAET